MPGRVLILFAHPAPHKSRINRRLIASVRGLDNVTMLSQNSDEKDFLGEIRRRVRTIDELFEAERAGQAFRYDAGWDPPRAG